MSPNRSRNGGNLKANYSLDMDKQSSNSRGSHLSAATAYSQREPSYDDPPPPPSRFRRVVDSFKPEEISSIDRKLPRAVDANGIEQMSLEEGIVINSAAPQGKLARHLKGRHLQMIAIGGSIG